MNESRNWLHLVFVALSGLVLLFIVAPLIGLALDTPGDTLRETAADREVRESIWLTLWTSMAATLIVAIAGIPLAYVLAKKTFPMKGLVSAIIDVPIVIPHSAAGIALLGVLAPGESLVGGLADDLGLTFVGSHLGIMAAMAYVSVPFLINAARDGFDAVPEHLERAAYSLGASPARVFFTVSLPLAWRPILSGLILMWGRGMSEFGAVLIIAYHPMVTPVMLWERFSAYGLDYARPVALIFVVICLAVFAVLRILSVRRSHA